MLIVLWVQKFSATLNSLHHYVFIWFDMFYLFGLYFLDIMVYCLFGFLLCLFVWYPAPRFVCLTCCTHFISLVPALFVWHSLCRLASCFFVCHFNILCCSLSFWHHALFFVVWHHALFFFLLTSCVVCLTLYFVLMSSCYVWYLLCLISVWHPALSF